MKNQAFVRKVPANQAFLTWRHPRTSPTRCSESPYGYLGLFLDSSDGEYDYYYCNIDYCPEHGWYCPGMDEEDMDGLGLIAWMPLPELPEMDGGIIDG